MSILQLSDFVVSSIESSTEQWIQVSPGGFNGGLVIMLRGRKAGTLRPAPVKHFRCVCCVYMCIQCFMLWLVRCDCCECCDDVCCFGVAGCCVFVVSLSCCFSFSCCHHSFYLILLFLSFFLSAGGGGWWNWSALLFWLGFATLRWW